MASVLYFWGLAKTPDRRNRLKLRRRREMRFYLKPHQGKRKGPSFQQIRGEAVIQPVMAGMVLGVLAPAPFCEYMRTTV